MKGEKTIYSQLTVSNSLERTLTLTSAQQEALKWLAIISMSVDHINQVTFMGNLSMLSYLGRLAFPLFAFLIAFNIARRDVAVKRYVWPLLIFGVTSQPIFAWAFDRTYFNIFFTLLLGVLYLSVMQRLRKRMPHVPSAALHVVAVILFALPSAYVSYPLFGAFLIPLLVAFLRAPSFIAVALLSFYLMLTNMLTPMSIYALLIVPAILIVSRIPFELPRSSKWLFYSFYPLHLVALRLLQNIV